MENSMHSDRDFGLANRLPVLVILCAPLFLIFLAYLGGNPAPSIAEASAPAKEGKSSVNAAIYEFEPALALRTSACITCHAKIRSAYITDFGYGDSYFFGKAAEGSSLSSFNGSVYGDFYGAEPQKTAWLTATIDGSIIVPKASFDFNLSALAGSGLAGQPAYRDPLKATSLAKYLQALENQKAHPAPIIEKTGVFIGAPSAATLEARFGIAPGSNVSFKYLKSDPGASPNVSGIGPSAGKDYYTNTSEVICDGDLFVRGTLFLNRLVLSTRNGCRIYATGPIFVQNAVMQKSSSNAANDANLQLVSSEAILLGTGDKSCDPKSSESPLSRRLVSGYAVSTFFTRNALSKSIAPKEAGQSIYNQAKSIASLEDASCHDDSIGFSGMLLNAPIVHSRYKGKFKGLVIAEVALFPPGYADFEFDRVFKRVPVLPLLKDADYLAIQ